MTKITEITETYSFVLRQEMKLTLLSLISDKSSRPPYGKDLTFVYGRG